MGPFAMNAPQNNSEMTRSALWGQKVARVIIISSTRAEAKAQKEEEMTERNHDEFVENVRMPTMRLIANAVQESFAAGSPPISLDVATLVKPTVLFVDDEPSLLQGIRDALRKEPYDIFIASSASEGIEILGTRRIDVVVSDERMPGMCGSKFLGHVCHDYPETIRIMLTGQASLDSAIRAINQGEVYRFLTKPCSPMELAQTIRGALLLINLARESSRLLARVREQRQLLEEFEHELERDHPGITRVERREGGHILLEAEDDCEIASLIEEIRMELEQTLPVLDSEGVANEAHLERPAKR